MRFLFPFVLLLLFLFRNFMKKSDKKQRDADRLFWERESKSNDVRKKDIEHLHYITIPENLPPIDSDNSKANALLAQLESMRGKRILNLTGMSNTDLKMEYGVANLPFLSEYDDNFTELAKTVASLGHILYEEGNLTDAAFFLEFGIQCNTDITSNYADLAAIYDQSGRRDQINSLEQRATNLNSLSKKVIIQKLQAYQ